MEDENLGMRKPFLNKYVIGDSREIRTILPSRPFIDVTITSPPYWKLKNYGSRKQIGFGQTYPEFLQDLRQIFDGVRQVTKDTGSLWVIADTIKSEGQLKLFPFDLAEQLRQVGWHLQDIIIWNKDKTLPWSHRGKLRNIFEYILFFSKGMRFQYYLSPVRETNGLKEWWIRYPERYSPQGKAPARTWIIPIPRQGSWGENWVRHFCPLPPELVRRIVLLTTKRKDVVLDPFAGSGVVLAEADALRRRYIGVDLRESYQHMFERKVRPSVSRLEKGNSQSIGRQEKQKRKFADLIWRLRKVKYPRELVRLYRKDHKRAGIAGVLAMSHGIKSLKIFPVFKKESALPLHIQSRLKAIMRRPPLSKYGISASVVPLFVSHRSKKDILPKDVPRTVKVSLYSTKNTHQRAGQTSARIFLERLITSNGHSDSSSLPIAVNISLDVTKESLFSL